MLHTSPSERSSASKLDYGSSRLFIWHLYWLLQRLLQGCLALGYEVLPQRWFHRGASRGRGVLSGRTWQVLPNDPRSQEVESWLLKIIHLVPPLATLRDDSLVWLLPWVPHFFGRVGFSHCIPWWFQHVNTIYLVHLSGTLKIVSLLSYLGLFSSFAVLFSSRW